MNNKTNYTIVGILVIVFFVTIFGFVLWLMQPNKDQNVQEYNIYFTESVSGLNVDSPVKFRGIVVGRVSKMQINPKNSEEIEVKVSIVSNTPIKIDTVAKLMSQGITGLSYINLSRGSKSAKILKPNGKEIPTILSIPSFFERIDKSLNTISSRISKTLDGTQRLLGEKNQVEFEKVLSNINFLLANLNNTFNQKTIDDLHESLSNAKKFTKDLNGLTPKVANLIDNTIKFEDNFNKSFNDLTEASESVAVLSKSLRESNERGDYSIGTYMKAPMQNFDRAMQAMEVSMMKMNLVMDKLSRSPSDLLFIEEKKKLGPGE